MRMDVNGDGSLTKREMLAADEFTPEEVRNKTQFSDLTKWSDRAESNIYPCLNGLD